MNTIALLQLKMQRKGLRKLEKRTIFGHLIHGYQIH